ncbi:FecR family protein [Noviherbaspirillum aerium]|uniref:FecR family protein n=1 Tax=Noviherbaspirillum aerium TaxID=2588497 RepID=UPI00124C3B95|nr:FecR family protein [Noviherbaspirillum aerium]
MFRFLISALHVTALLACLPAAAQSVVGDIVFASGQVQVANGGSTRAAKIGEAIKQGDELVTKADGYIYVKTRDQGFVSLRPNSAVQFDLYEYAADKPQESRIKTTLKYGVLRSVSGVGAQSAKDKYRLNTPVAAIGIRGTDFTVFANAEVTRATVTSGGIVMSGFNDSCAPSGTGPCNGIQGAELYAQQSGMMLQLRRGDSRPALLDRESSNLRPDVVAPPLPGEKVEKGAAASGTTTSADLAGNQAITLKQGIALQEKLQLEQKTATPPAVPVVTPPVAEPSLPAPPPPAQAVFWGRWQPFAGASASTAGKDWSAVEADKQLAVVSLANSVFGLARNMQTDMAMPGAGIFNFALQSHESYILNEATSRLTTARIENPALRINFNNREFDTSFKLVNESHAVDVAANGGITGNGLMFSDNIKSSATVRGALANGGQQAGYLFEQRINERELAVGATYWSR